MKTSLKPLLSLLIILFYYSGLVAQDTLYLNDGTKIGSRILEVGVKEIKYKKADNPDGPTFITLNSEITAIKYRNGVVDTIKQQKPVEVKTTASSYVAPPYDPTPPIYRRGPIYKQSYGRIKENYMHSVLKKVNDPQINLHVRNAKIAKGVQYVGFVAIPTAIVGGVFAFSNLINGESDFTPSIACGFFAAACLSASITSHSIRVKNNDAAIKIYNEKY